MTLAQAFRRFPIGTKVQFYPLSGEQHFEESEVQSEPWALGHGQVVIKITGRSGGVAVDQLRAA
ncbi:hypothetical protein ASG54_22595 [Aureimonas sp. Leaf460]|nr:hypothetical protein ASG62_16465 [Aureimonas sp. Leaf427]KQT65747.1 hypothetical protein ASG54_22595 [Aureimonas sp. Leaf460]